MGTRSVRARSTIWATVIVAVGLIAGSALVVFLLQRALIATVENGAATRASDVAQLVRTGTLEEVQRDVLNNTVESQIVQVIDPNGTIVAASSPNAEKERLSTLRPAPGAVVNQRRNALDFLHTTDPYLITAVATQKDGQTWTVIVAASIAPQSESVEQLISYLLILVPVGILLAAVGTWFTVGRALRPVETVRRKVAAIGAGRLTERVPVPPSHDEVSRLAETMNEMLDRLEAGQHVQRAFVSDASHELRSPLATLGVSLDVVGDAPSGQRWRESRQVMREEVERMRRLVDDLLLLARIDDAGLAPVREEVDLDDLMIQEAQRLRGLGNIAVTTSISPARVLGDRDRWAQALRNVVDNAAHAASSHIHLGVSTEDSEAILVVEDDGAGVPAAHRSRIFERFVRLDESRSRDSGGSGLGLAITYEIVVAQHASITMEESSSGGARVVIRVGLDP